MQSNLDGPAAITDIEDVLKHVRLGEEARMLAPGCTDPAQLLQRLEIARLPVESIRVLAYTAPLRRVVWWSILAAWHGLDGKPEPVQDRVIGAATRWVLAPTEEHRREAEDIDGDDLPESPAGYCARAASLAGSAASPDEELKPLQPLRAARMVVASVFQSYVCRAKIDGTVTYRRFLELGRHAVEGRVEWGNR